MRASTIREIDYQVGQIWYVKERTDESRYIFVPVRIIGIYPHILLTENRKGRKQAFTKACAFLNLFTAAEAKSNRDKTE